MIETHQLTKRYGTLLAVDGLDLRVGGPGVVGFLGPNGAGKTTTLRMLTGFLGITEGTAVVCGHDVFEAPLEVKARVGYLPEIPPLYPELTVGEYLRFVAEIRGVPRRRRLARVGEVMERVGLDRWEGRLTGELSKGYRQRVGLAQALVHDPALLILDEPTAGLDPAQVVGVRRLIGELARERTVLLSTHILSEVERLCERVILLCGGRIAGDGTVEALARQAGTGPWVELVVDAPPETLAAQLAELGAVDSVRPLAPGRVGLTGSEGLTGDVVALAAARGWRVRELTRHPASLEAAFLALTGGEA